MSLTDVIYGPAKILAIILTFFVVYFIWSSFTTTFNSSVLPSMSVENQAILNETTSNISIGMTTIDYMMPIIVVGLLIVSLIFAFKTGASVVYAVLSIIMWIFALIMSAIFTNTYSQFDATIDLGSTLTISNFLMLNLKWIVLGWLALISIVMFSRNKQETEGINSDMVFRG